MREPQLLDVVRLMIPASGFGLSDGEDEVEVAAGDKGAIVEVFDEPDKAFLVEFSNDYGETVAMVTLKPDQFEVVYPLGRVPEQVGA